MSRVIITAACILPSGERIPKGACLEVTAAMAAPIASAGGTTRAVSAMSATAGHDQLGESVGVSNSSA
jgi:hypothetical protein